MNINRVKQKKVKAEQVMTRFGLPDRESVMLQRCQLFTSVLAQFSKEHIRADYAAGKFRSPDNVSVSTEELALFYLELIPTIDDGGSIKRVLETAQEKLWMVVTKQEESFILSNSVYKPRKCAEWNNIVMSLCFNNTYWLSKPNAKKNVQQTITKKKYEKATSTDIIGTRTIGVNAGKEVEDCAVQTSQNIETKANILLIHKESHSIPIEEKINLKLTNSNNNNTVSNLVCKFCLKTNHCEETCWRKKGLCLVCGGEHRVVNCTKNKNSIQNNVNCPVCNGTHLGRFCEVYLHRLNFCNWCGKRGHRVNFCRMRLGACYYCGDLHHQIKDCPTHFEKQKGSSDYWWDVEAECEI